MKYGIRVKDIITKRLVTVGQKLNIVSAAKIMKRENVGALEILEKGKIVGIITDGDIIRKVVAEGLNPKKVKISDIMTRNPITVSPDDDIYAVLKLMEQKGVKRVLVVNEKGKLVGYLSERIILKIQSSLLDVLIEKMKILQPSFKLKYSRG